MRALLLALLLAAPAVAPAVAQDAPPVAWADGPQDLAQTPEAFAARNRAALDAYVLPGQAPGQGFVDDAAVVALLPSLEGSWLRGTLTLQLDPLAPDAALVATACDRTGAVLARTTPRSFEMRVRIDPDDPAATYSERYDLVIGNTFLRSFDEAGFLRRLFGPDADTPEGLARLPQPVVANSLAQSGRGEVMLFHPSPEILVILQPGRPADLWLRCP